MCSKCFAAKSNNATTAVQQVDEYSKPSAMSAKPDLYHNGNNARKIHGVR